MNTLVTPRAHVQQGVKQSPVVSVCPYIYMSVPQKNIEIDAKLVQFCKIMRTYDFV